MKELIQALNAGIDEARADLWETNDILSLNEPTDNHGRIAARQAAQAEAWQAVMDFREERIDFDELLMSLQSFDKNVTPYDVARVLRGDI